MAKSTTKKTKASKTTGKKKGSARKVKSPAKVSARGEVSAFEPFQTLRKQVDDLFSNFTVSWPHFEMPKIEWPMLAGEGRGRNSQIRSERERQCGQGGCRHSGDGRKRR